MTCGLMEASVWGQTQVWVLSRSRVGPGALPAFPGVISTDEQKERKRKGREVGKQVIRVELSQAQYWLAQGCINHNQSIIFAFRCITLFSSTQAQGQLKS